MAMKESKNMKKTEEATKRKNDSYEVEQKINDYRYELDSINAWIVNADNKVSIYCGLYSIVLAVIAFVAKYILFDDTPADVGCSCYRWFQFFAIMTLLSFLTAIYFYTWAVKPNMIGKTKKNNTDIRENSLFYKDISRFRSADEYIKIVYEADRDDYCKELLKEVYFNSKVCTEKMKHFQVGVIASGASIFLAVIACSLYYITTTC